MPFRNRITPSHLLVMAVLLGPVLASSDTSAQSASTLAWAPRPSRLVPYAAPNRPLWKLSDILARHAGEKDWSEPVADTPDFVARYVSMAPVPIRARPLRVCWATRMPADWPGLRGG
ncbi:MAG TPA: hypothetical protein VMO78_15385 [Rhizomicrobium sp.]|nr:hypothetical protein [Rhizomicrobium sp.]